MKTQPRKCACAGVPLFACPNCGSPGLSERVTRRAALREATHYPLDRLGYAERVRELEAEGLCTSDAQGVADAEARESDSERF